MTLCDAGDVFTIPGNLEKSSTRFRAGWRTSFRQAHCR